MTWLRDNRLSITLFLLFSFSVTGHGWAGWTANNEDLAREGEGALTSLAYLQGPVFGSTLFENCESEFLQIGAYVVLTAYLFQRGSPESKDPGEPAPSRIAIRVGGWRALYILTLSGLAAFVLHWTNSTEDAAEDAIRHGEAPPTLFEHLASAQHWFEFFQNWQSEFLSNAVLIVLVIFLRERGSPESKPVAAPHSQTGTD